MGEQHYRTLYKQHPELKAPPIILSGYVGSISHGTYVPNSNPSSIDDKDVMCISIPGIDYYYGLKGYGSRGTKIIKQDEWDIVIYELKKMISLLLKGNPNVLCMLWLDPTDYIEVTPIGQKLLNAREIFVSRQVYHSFIGYAHSQAHRMTHMAFEGYMGEKRKNLVKQHGYDTKNASHLIRLLRMGIEFLTEGELYVKRRNDATQLIEIKRGEWTLEQVKAEADRLFALAEEAYIRSPLPAKPDEKEANALCIEMLRDMLDE